MADLPNVNVDEIGVFQHAFGHRHHRLRQSRYGFTQHPDGTGHQHHPIQQGTEQRQSLVTIGELVICAAPAHPIQQPGTADGQAIPKVMHGIGHDGGTVGEPPPHKLNNRERQIEEKRGRNTPAALRLL